VVVEIVRAVAISPLPSAPTVIEGLIDVRGQVVPVFNLRHRFGFPAREIDVGDHFILARASRRVAALHVDRVLELADVDDDTVSWLSDTVPGCVAGGRGRDAARWLALLHDVDAFLSAAEAESLGAAMRVAATPVVATP
jgi:purine-binding chemotaxis protein CheW